MTLDYIYGASPPMYYSMIESSYKRQLSRQINSVGRKNKFNQLYGMCIDNHVKSAMTQPQFINEKVLKSCLKLCLNQQQQDLPKHKNGSIKTEKSHKLRKQKKVSFADAHGQELTLVKYLTAASNEPPELNFLNDILSHLNVSTNGDKESKNLNEKKPKFILKFAQPVADYMNFKMRLDSNNVCIENALVNSDNVIKGTVKVKNLDFHKNVIVVTTFDEWKTSHEILASYVNSPYNHKVYDTFQFNIKIPSNFCPYSNHIEFCVRYRVLGKEYWDNNDKLNYVITTDCLNTHKRRLSDTEVPSLYSELPTPEENLWKGWENSRFY